MRFLTALAAMLRRAPEVPSAPSRRPMSPRAEPPNLGSTATAASIQAAIRSAENGDTTNLFRLYRDSLLSDDLIQGCFATRKLAVLAQPLAIMPRRKGNADDMAAAAAVQRAIDDCENWLDAIGSLLDSALWPVSVAEKIFAPAEVRHGEVRLAYTLKRIEAVNPMLFSFRHGYQGNAGPEAGAPGTAGPEAGAPVAWEPWLRLSAVNESGGIDYSPGNATALTPDAHIVHRGHLLSGFRDNWGGPMRCVLGWWLLRGLGRDWFGRFMERYGVPFPKGKTNMQDSGAVAFLQEAFSLSTKIGGIVIGQDDEVELVQAAVQGGAEGHKLWLDTCNGAISRAITGIEANAAPAGLNAGQSNRAENVREDVRMFDQVKLTHCLERQLFAQFLRVNGLPGKVKLSFGGLSDADAATFAGTLNTLAQAGFEPTDEAVPVLQDRLGMAVRRKAAVAPEFQGSSFKFQGGGPLSTRPLSAQAVTADALGVPTGWLNPVSEFLAELQTKAADKSLSDADLLAFLEKASARVPELFGKMDVEELAKVLEAGMGQAVIDAARMKLRK